MLAHTTDVVSALPFRSFTRRDRCVLEKAGLHKLQKERAPQSRSWDWMQNQIMRKKISNFAIFWSQFNSDIRFRQWIQSKWKHEKRRRPFNTIPTTESHVTMEKGGFTAHTEDTKHPRRQQICSHIFFSPKVSPGHDVQIKTEERCQYVLGRQGEGGGAKIKKYNWGPTWRPRPPHEPSKNIHSFLYYLIAPWTMQRIDIEHDDWWEKLSSWREASWRKSIPSTILDVWSVWENEVDS